MIETVYNQRNNPNTVQFLREDGAPLDFSSATRMVLKFKGSIIQADTDIDASLIDFSTGNGDVIFNINGLGLPDCSVFGASLIVYDPAHVDGQIIVHAKESSLFFRFIDPL